MSNLLNKYRYGVMTGSVLLATTLTSAAIAQTLPDSATTTADPARASERLREDTIMRRVSPMIEVEEVSLRRAPPGAENVSLELDTLQMSGVTVYTAADLEPLYASQLGTTISLADLYAIANRIAMKYRNDGYVLAQVIVPPQTIENGTARLQVLEGTIGNVTVGGNINGDARATVQSYAAQITDYRNPAVNIRSLERQLLLINDLPGVRARSVLSPSPSEVGAADLAVIVERDPYDAIIGIDNYGSRFLGRYQASAAVALNNPFFNQNERVTGQFVAALSDDQAYELAYIGVGYEQPVWKYGTLVQLFASHTDTKPGFTLDQFDVEGRSQYYSVGLEHPFIRTRNQNLSGRILFDWRDVETRNNINDDRDDNIRALRAGGRYDVVDTLIGVGLNTFDIEVARGLSILGASDDNDPRLSRPAGEPEFTKVNVEIQRLQSIVNNVNLLIAGRGQWSDDALLSAEEFGVGGPSFGRGFDSSEITGDDGVAGKVELQWNEPVEISFIDDYQLFGFYDAGRVWNDDASTLKLEEETLTSTGLGVRSTVMESVFADFMVALPLNRDVGTEDNQDPRFFFSVKKQF